MLSRKIVDSSENTDGRRESGLVYMNNLRLFAIIINEEEKCISFAFCLHFAFEVFE